MYSGTENRDLHCRHCGSKSGEVEEKMYRRKVYTKEYKWSTRTEKKELHCRHCGSKSGEVEEKYIVFEDGTEVLCDIDLNEILSGIMFIDTYEFYHFLAQSVKKMKESIDSADLFWGKDEDIPESVDRSLFEDQ